MRDAKTEAKTARETFEAKVASINATLTQLRKELAAAQREQERSVQRAFERAETQGIDTDSDEWQALLPLQVSEIELVSLE